MSRSEDSQLRRRRFLQTALAAPALLSLGDAQSPATIPSKPRLSLNVRELGATGDGATKDTAALQQAIDRCSVLGGGEVLVPPGNYLTGALALRPNTILRLEKDAVLMGTPDFADYPVTQVRWEGKWIQGHVGLIYAIGVDHIGVIGPGRIVGNTALGGRPTPENPLRHPSLIEPIGCNDVRFEDFSTEYRLMWCVHATNCENVSIRNLTIRSTGGNGDGIDIDSCKHVRIDGCDISTGDDCISLKSGRGMEAYVLHRPTEDVQISNCTFADSISRASESAARPPAASATCASSTANSRARGRSPCTSRAVRVAGRLSRTSWRTTWMSRVWMAVSCASISSIAAFRTRRRYPERKAFPTCGISGSRMCG